MMPDIKNEVGATHGKMMYPRDYINARKDMYQMVRPQEMRRFFTTLEYEFTHYMEQVKFPRIPRNVHYVSLDNTDVYHITLIYYDADKRPMEIKTTRRKATLREKSREPYW